MAVYSMDSCSDNCYPGTTVLVNKLDIHEQKELDIAEKQITLLRAIQAEQSMSFDNPDLNFYLSIHRFLFEDIYEWAGMFRNVNISKKGTVFCKADQIKGTCILKFQRLAEHNYFADLDTTNFISEVAEFYNEMNLIHPFREGNGRTLRLFITLLVRNTKRNISFADIDPDILMIATI
ncbi:MAG: Fic family protein, partial [Oscillospiraceae bacterium]|nr:Fic family protein [Oscillospiraceae bacterium]